MVQMNMTKKTIERRVYTLMDWANEVGGFFGFIELLMLLMLPFF